MEFQHRVRQVFHHVVGIKGVEGPVLEGKLVAQVSPNVDLGRQEIRVNVDPSLEIISFTRSQLNLVHALRGGQEKAIKGSAPSHREFQKKVKSRLDPPRH